MPSFRLHDHEGNDVGLLLHDHEGNDVGLLEHPAPNVEPGDVVVLADGREALVTARVETGSGTLAALLEVVVVG